MKRLRVPSVHVALFCAWLVLAPTTLHAQALASAPALTTARAAQPTFSPKAFMGHVEYLAGDELEGRGYRTEGLEKAALYIEAAFREAGLAPGAGDTYSQPLPDAAPAVITAHASLVFEGVDLELKVRRDFVPLPVSSDDPFEGPLAFAGYAICNPDAGYDDYSDFDARGKVLLIFRYEPRDEDPEAEFGGEEPSRYASFRHKAAEARKRGASALLIVDPPLPGDDEDKLYRIGAVTDPECFDIPMLHVTREVAGQLLDAAGAPDLASLQRALDTSRKPLSMDLKGLRARGRPGLIRTKPHNIVGLLRGRGPKADEYVVVGAHYDHLGRSRRPSFLRVTTQPAIYHGADDNASGTAGVIELARAFAGGQAPQRSILFVAFTAEEEGLLGSRHFVANPPVPLKQIVGMVNLDMIGRLRDDRLDVRGVASGDDLGVLLERLGTEYEVHVRMQAKPGGGSDHRPFADKGIPVVFFNTGAHVDLHRPTDHPQKINADGAVRVQGLAHGIVNALANGEGRPKSAGTRRRPSLGVIFGEPEEGQPGLMIGRVIAGGPAARAGVKSGDRLVGFGDQDVASTDDVIRWLAQLEPGQSAELTLLRDGERIKVAVEFDKP